MVFSNDLLRYSRILPVAPPAPTSVIFFSAKMENVLLLYFNVHSMDGIEVSVPD